MICMEDSAPSADDVEAALLEYEEFSAEINALSMAQALRVCEIEGIAPRDPTLLGMRSALLLHFCGPPPRHDHPSAGGSKSGSQLRKARKAAGASGGERRVRLDGGQSPAAIPIWCWRKMAELVDAPKVDDVRLRERLATMPWHEAKIACSRLGIQTDKASLLEVRANIERCLLAPQDSPDAAAARLIPSDYKLIVKHMNEEQSIAAAKNLGIVPMEWTEKMCKAALLSHLSPPPILETLADDNGRRGVAAMMKAMSAGASKITNKGMSPFEKWRQYKKSKLEGFDSGLARLMFEEIDTDGSGELTAPELREIAEKLGGGVTDEEIDDALMEMDHSGDGSIGVAEFEAWWSSARASDGAWTRLINKRERQEQERAWMQELFDAIDAGIQHRVTPTVFRKLTARVQISADGGGTLDKEEVGELVADLGLALNELELDTAFQEL